MPSPRHDRSLRGLRVWVTRPAHQARALVKQIEDAGGTALKVPLLRIEPIDPDPDQSLLGNLQGYQIVIFISANAVIAALPHLRAAGGLPANIKVGVIGKGTARTLRESLGREPDLVPADQFDSEGLLALPDLQAPRGAAVLIVRGDHGREVLAEGLQARGARVDYVSVYQRRLVAVDLAADLDPPPEVIVVTSSEALRHLTALAKQQQQGWVFDKGLVVVHERIKALAQELGFKADIRVTSTADNAEVVETLAAWVQYTGSAS